MTRPLLRYRPHTWSGNGSQTAGIMLYVGRNWTFITPEQARATADALHDLADKQEAQNATATA